MSVGLFVSVFNMVFMSLSTCQNNLLLTLMSVMLCRQIGLLLTVFGFMKWRIKCSSLSPATKVN
jgi:hypothetical protein